MTDALIDPASRDYVLLDGAAQPDPSGGLANSCHIRLVTRRGSYWADRSLGSRLHELQRMKDVPRMAKLAKQYAEQALAPILAEGRATAVVVATEQPHNGRLHLLVKVTALDGAEFRFTHPVGVI